MTNDAEKAAREYAEQRCVTRDGDRQSVGMEAFLAGAKWREENQWISIDAEYPTPYKTVRLLEANSGEWFGHYDSACDQFVYHFGHDELSDRTFTHWQKLAPLPKQPERGKV